jgi:hypothetical protein
MGIDNKAIATAKSKTAIAIKVNRLLTFYPE